MQARVRLTVIGQRRRRHYWTGRSPAPTGLGTAKMEGTDAAGSRRRGDRI